MEDSEYLYDFDRYASAYGLAKLAQEEFAKGFILKFKPVLPAKSKEKQKGDIDAHLAFTVMRYYNEFNKAVVVSSDGDFDTVITYLRAKKKLGMVISPGRNKCSSLLKKASGGDISYLDEIGEKVKRPGQNEKAPL